jgi:glyoxylase-like metal-dependent hydrolase (beta-lactamase superfamily II)
MAQAQQSIYEFDAGPSFLNTKSYFYDNGEEVVAFDAQLSTELAQKSIEFLKSKTKNPITFLVILNPAVERFNGVSAFKKIGAAVVASRKTAEAMQAEYDYQKDFFLNGGGRSIGFTKENWPALEKIDSLFEQSYRLELKNGQTVILRDLSKPGPTANQTLAYIAEEEALFAGDLVQPNMHPNIKGVMVGDKYVPMIVGWIDNLNEMNKIFKRDAGVMVYGGRGKPVSLPTAVYDQTRYLKFAYPIITSFYYSNRSNWVDTNVPPKFYKELQAEMEAAFPGYASGYLTRTGLWTCWGCVGAEKLK